jgi:DNA processing protein
MKASQGLSKFPCELNNLDEPLKALHYQGDLSLLNLRKVSIVGARRAYPYSRTITHSLALALVKRNVCVVSGAAMGIDAIAHEAAYPKTIAVMANGLNVIYPKVNKKLISKMAESSLILSEYENNFEGRAYTFVERNRIVVALGEVLVISQADLNSGSMRSAEFALAMGKKIYVLPHRLGESSGTMKLLEEGNAELITDIEKFADLFGSVMPIEDSFLAFCSHSPSYEDVLSFDSQKLFEYELLGKIKVVSGRVQVT